MKVLVAGGAGYIGSHTCVALQEAGHDVVIVDSLVNSQPECIDKLQKITREKACFIQADLRDRTRLAWIFSEHRIDAVINFAGHKAVNESIWRPLEYYDNNLNCAISLLECMLAAGVRQLVFSSSAAIYGHAAVLPIAESAPLAPENPYGRTKQQIEEILLDMANADTEWRLAILRYFNPVGAHPSGLIGELPSGLPNNLMPLIANVAAGEMNRLDIFGGDYETEDGTAVRDFIHVMDLAEGHVQALHSLEQSIEGKVITANLGTGVGHSVLELVRAFEVASGREIPYSIVARRAGDVAVSYADPTLARRELDWHAKLGLEAMCRDTWNWKSSFR